MRTLLTITYLLVFTSLFSQKVGINTTTPQASLDILNIGDGAELLRLSTERPWVFKQTENSIFTRLTLKPTTNGKSFEIVTDSDSIILAEFYALDPDPRVFLIPEAGRLGIGTKSPNARVNIHGTPELTENLLRLWVTHNEGLDTRGIDCESKPAEGYGIGGDFIAGHRGVRGIVEAGNSSRLGIGVVGAASGTSTTGTRVGLWGNAFGGLTNWAGYFDNGNVYIKNNLRIGSGAINGTGDYRLAIDGKIIAEEVKVQLSTAWPDYVFDQDYKLQSLEELEKEISVLGHLPGVPSAEEVAKEGIMLGDMNKILLEKIEELTLHVIALKKELDDLKNNGIQE
ncbi:hypothetical protein [Portibacter lacus]|uniref:Peptidase S74 domain-containing protein n=1 Tax=Portibacter lacus TaxID=1099794 RepID=A0AA37WEW4_9BACT|nr:hypothetical protein [Portibacter lacus]GLR17144.1 hypothetical protein GCM10007940_17590 [Portibacter lacus]